MLELTQTQKSIYLEGKFFGEVVNNIGGYQKYFVALDVARFTRARDLVLGSNDAYRLRFLEQDGACQAVLADAVPSPLPLIDCSQESGPARHAQTWIQDRFETGFGDLTRQVFQDALLKIASNEYWYFAKAHHLIMDGWAFALQMQRITELYERLGTEAEAVDTVSYPSYVEHLQRQDRYGTGKAYLDDKAYWLARHTASGGPQLPLRDDGREREPALSQRVSRMLERPLFDTLLGLAQRADANIVAVVYAVLYLYFSRAYGAADVVIGMPVHNRRSAAEKQIIGSLVNVNACPVRAPHSEPFIGLVRRLAQDLRRDFRHSRFPIGDLVGLLREQGRPVGDTHQISFNYQKLDFGLVVDGHPVETHYLSHNHERTAATFVMCEFGAAQDIALHLDFSVRYFDQAAAAAVLDSVHGLLQQAMLHPELPLDQFDLLTEAERRRQLVEWNDSVVALDTQACIDGLLEQQARATPDQLAIQSTAGSLSYAELHRQANRIAHHLIGMGVAQEQMVGVYMRRTPGMIVAMLAILKAGACYVPIDTTYPRARIDYILDDSAVSLVLTDAVSGPELPSATGRIDVAQFLAAPAPPHTLETPARAGRHAAQLAYVIYTSGSTGQPKGVLLEHRNAVALINWAAGVYSSDELRGVLAATSICFDLSVFEIFVPLALGGGVILAENALALRDGVAGEVTLINTVPSAMRALLQARAIPSCTRCINLAGELLPQELVDAIHAACGVRVFDLYGPSEATTYSTFVLRRPGGQATIGRPIDNTRVYVFDEQGNPLPQGLVGELLIGGAGLARGYLKRPDLTAERFVFNRHADERVYRTGDLVRFTPDGQLQYIGRKDHQLKIRGHRIEPGEIEACIGRHPQVQVCAVVPRQEQSGDMSLVAGLVPQPGVETPAALVDVVRAMVSQALPAYMVPTAFVCLEALPLTANGKLDRAALAALDAPATPEAGALLPQTGTQRRVAHLWQLVLGREVPGLDAGFFKVGGDSLLLLKLAAQLETEFAVRIALPALFAHVTVASQARWIDQLREVDSLLAQVKLTGDTHQEEYIEI